MSGPARPGSFAPKLAIRKKRPGKGAEPSETIQALERLKLSTQEQLRALTQEHEVRGCCARV